MVRRLRKTKQSQKYNYQTNRKRLNKKIHGTGMIQCLEIRKAADPKKKLAANIRDMGLAYNVNRTIPIPNSKQERLKVAKYVNGFLEEDNSDTEPTVDVEAKKRKNPKAYVAEKLEQDANEYVESRFRLPKGQVKYVTD
ncbi:nucleolar protein 16-like, partial [Uranotaenia lowii]